MWNTSPEPATCFLGLPAAENTAWPNNTAEHQASATREKNKETSRQASKAVNTINAVKSLSARAVTYLQKLRMKDAPLP